jgi:hypothetical protein
VTNDGEKQVKGHLGLFELFSVRLEQTKNNLSVRSEKIKTQSSEDQVVPFRHILKFLSTSIPFGSAESRGESMQRGQLTVSNLLARSKNTRLRATANKLNSAQFAQCERRGLKYTYISPSKPGT